MTNLKTAKFVELYRSPRLPYIDYARDDEMERLMNVIEFDKGKKHVHALLLGIFEGVGAWHTFPTTPKADYLALLLSTHLKRDARFRITRFLLHNGCHPVRMTLWFKTRGMLHDYAARLDVKALLLAFPQPYNPDGKNYCIPDTVSRRTTEPHFERTVDELSPWCTTSLTAGFTYANGIMDDVIAGALSVLMFESSAGGGARGRFSVPAGDHLSQALGGDTARVQKAMEVYEAARDRFVALNQTEAPSEPYDGLKWIVDLAKIPPSPPCSPPGSSKIINPEYGPFWPSCELCCGMTEAVEVGKCRASKGKEVFMLCCTMCPYKVGLLTRMRIEADSKAPPPSPPCSPPGTPGSPTPPASPMGDVEPPPLSFPPPLSLSLLADVSGFKAMIEGHEAKLQAAAVTAQKAYDAASAELVASVASMQAQLVALGVSSDVASNADDRHNLAEQQLAKAKAALTRCNPACKAVVPMQDEKACCLEFCDRRFHNSVPASGYTFLSVESMGRKGKNKFFTDAEEAAFTRKVQPRGHTAPDLVFQKLGTAGRAVGGMKNKFLDKIARRNPALFAFPLTYPRPSPWHIAPAYFMKSTQPLPPVNLPSLSRPS